MNTMSSKTHDYEPSPETPAAVLKRVKDAQPKRPDNAEQAAKEYRRWAYLSNQSLEDSELFGDFLWVNVDKLGALSKHLPRKMIPKYLMLLTHVGYNGIVGRQRCGKSYASDKIANVWGMTERSAKELLSAIVESGYLKQLSQEDGSVEGYSVPNSIAVKGSLSGALEGKVNEQYAKLFLPSVRVLFKDKIGLMILEYLTDILAHLRFKNNLLCSYPDSVDETLCEPLSISELLRSVGVPRTTANRVADTIVDAQFMTNNTGTERIFHPILARDHEGVTPGLLLNPRIISVMSKREMYDRERLFLIDEDQLIQYGPKREKDMSLIKKRVGKSRSRSKNEKAKKKGDS